MSLNFFTLLQLPETFVIDLKKLDQNYQSIQKEIHPDRFASLADEEKIENLRKDVGLTVEQTQDILLQLIRERKEEELEQERNKYCFCPHCGHKLPD